MKKTIIIIFLMVFLVSMGVYGVESGTLNINGGTFEYTDAYNISNGSNWVLINCTTSIDSNYTIKPSEAWSVDCGSGGDTLPSDGTTYTTNIKAYTGTYYLPTGIVLSTSSRQADLNGLTMIGNGTANLRAIYSGTNTDTVNVTNVTIQNYHRGMLFSGNHANIEITNSIISDISDDAIYCTGTCSNWLIENNYFSNVTAKVFHTDTTTEGGLFKSNVLDNAYELYIVKPNRWNISYNKFESTVTAKYHIRTFNWTNSFAEYNNFTGSSGAGSTAISIDGAKNVSINNNNFNTNYYGLRSDSATYKYGYNNVITDNVFYNLNTSIYLGYMHDINITSNTFNTSNYGGGSNEHGIMLGNAEVYNARVYDNTLNNMQFGILFEWGSHDNLYYNNIVTNTRIPIYELHDTYNNKAYDNALTCTTETGSVIAGIRIFDNASHSYYYNNTINCDVDLEVTSNVTNITYETQHNSNMKALTITNITLITAQPFNTYCNSTATTCVPNINETTETYGASTRGFLFTRTQDNDPYLSSIALSITDYSTTYDGTTLTIDCTGTGSHTIANILDLAGTKGYYRVYHNGAELDASNTATYTMSGCSNWEFVLTDTDPTGLENNRIIILFIAGLAVFGLFATIIALVVIAKSIVKILNMDMINANAELQKIAVFAAGLVVLAVVVVVGMLILLEFIGF